MQQNQHSPLQQVQCWSPTKGQWIHCELIKPVQKYSFHVIVFDFQDKVEHLVPRSWIRRPLSSLLGQPLTKISHANPQHNLSTLSIYSDYSRKDALSIQQQLLFTDNAKVESPSSHNKIDKVEELNIMKDGEKAVKEDANIAFDVILSQLAAKKQRLQECQQINQPAVSKTAQDGDNERFEEGIPNKQNSTKKLEFRVDPVDGLKYTLEDFLHEYGDEEGHLRWESAGILAKKVIHVPVVHSHKSSPIKRTNDKSQGKQVSDNQIEKSTNAANRNHLNKEQSGTPQVKKLTKSQLRNKNSKLLKAAKGGRLNSVRQLLRQKAQVCIKDANVLMSIS